MRPAPRVQSTALLAALAGTSRLPDFGFGCVGILLLIVQLCFHVKIRLHFSFRIRSAARLRTGWNAVLALVLGESLETLIELLAEVIVRISCRSSTAIATCEPNRNHPSGCC